MAWDDSNYLNKGFIDEVDGALNAGGGSAGGGSVGIPVVTTEGTSSAYTATVPGITELYNGLQITIIPHTKNTLTVPTFNLNNTGNLPIRTNGIMMNTNNGYSFDTGALVQGFPVTLTYRESTSDWIAKEYIGVTSISVKNGGTGRSKLDSGSYLVGYGINAVKMKTPAQVLADILPATADDAGKFVRVKSDGTIGLETVAVAEEASF